MIVWRADLSGSVLCCRRDGSLPLDSNCSSATRPRATRLLIVPTAETVPETHRFPYLKQVLAQEEYAKAILALGCSGRSGLARGIGPEHVRRDEAEHRPSRAEVVRLAVDQYQHDNATLHES